MELIIGAVYTDKSGDSFTLVEVKDKRVELQPTRKDVDYRLRSEYKKSFIKKYILIEDSVHVSEVFDDRDRFLSLFVYSNPITNGCGGICNTEKQIYIPNEEGNIKYSQIKDKRHLIFIPKQKSEDYWALNPIVRGLSNTWNMFGGHYAKGDSRDRKMYGIHDRFEFKL
jgi:hypothetical protein